MCSINITSLYYSIYEILSTLKIYTYCILVIVVSFKLYLNVCVEVNKDENICLLNLQACFDDAKDLADVAIDLNKDLEHKNSILMEQVQTLRTTVEMLERKLLEKHKTHVKLFKVSGKSLVLICNFHEWSDVSGNIRGEFELNGQEAESEETRQQQQSYKHNN